MNTRLLMSASAFVLGAAGILLIFFPQEFAIHFDLTGINILLLQILGALYFGYAMLNWTARANLTGGIYSRPVTIGNLTHFIVGGLALAKFAMRNPSLVWLWIIAIVYLLFALFFGIVFYTNPVIKNSST
jgi:hypothetical protein